MIAALKMLNLPAKGQFRFPQGNIALPGVLSVDADGAVRLEVSGHSGPHPSGFKSGEMFNPDVITGELDRNVHSVTLLENYYDPFSSPTRIRPGAVPEKTWERTYKPLALLAGNCRCMGAGIRFDEVLVEARNLNLWVWRGGASFNDSALSGGADGRRISIDYAGEKLLFAKKMKDAGEWAEFRIGERLVRAASPRLGDDIQRATVETTHFMGCKFAREVGIREVISAIRAILGFLSLGLGRSTYCLRVRVGGPAIRELTSASFLDMYVQNLFKETSPDEQMLENQCLFSLAGIERQLGSVFGRWISLHQNIPDILDYYFAVDGGPNLHMDTRFLCLAKSLESLYNKILGGETDVECEKAKRDALASCPAGRREWLRGKLAHACQPSFSKRVHGCICNFRDMTGIEFPNSEKIVREIRRIRNEATHKGPLKCSNDYSNMYVLSGLLSLLIKYALLRKIGVGEGAYCEHVKNDFQARETVRLAKNLQP